MSSEVLGGIVVLEETASFHIVKMRCTLVLPAIVSLAASQLIDLVAIGNTPDPVLVSAPLDVVTDTPPDVPAAPIEPITNAPSRVRRNLVQKRDGNCNPQPTGSGPVSTPDTVAAFQSNPDLQVSPKHRLGNNS